MRHIPLGVALLLCTADAGDVMDSLAKRWQRIFRGVPAAPWGDHYQRHRHRPGSVQRRLMEVKDPDTGKPYMPRADSKATVNGQAMDYSPWNCPWEAVLDNDYPAMCLPYQEILSPIPGLNTTEIFGANLVGDPAVRGAGYHADMECSDEIMRLTGARCAAKNTALGHGAICEGWVEDCTYSKPETRKCDSEKCGSWQKKTRCSGSECTAGYEAARLPYPKTYPGNNKGAFAPHADEDESLKCSKHDSALQWLKCGIPCPVPFSMSTSDMVGPAVVVVIFIVFSMLAGLATYFKVKGDSTEFFVAGRSLPIWILVFTLGSQCFDASSALGNLDLSYKYHFWDGAALPLGLGLSLVIVGVFLAKPLNEMKLFTLPDAFGRVYGDAAEVLVSLVTCVSFIFLLAGNLVGCGKIISFLFGMDALVGIAMATFVTWLYACAGGLLSVAWTDVVQAIVGWLGFLVATSWIQANMPNHPGISPAYPLGDATVHGSGAVNPDSYDPIPNAIFFNWATVIVLALGNCMALDFQARVFAAKDGNTARKACIIAGLVAGGLGIFNTWNGGVARALYGPSSPHAEFVANSCSADITVIGCFGAAAGSSKCNAIPLPGVPTCGEWKPDPYATLKMLTCTKADCHFFADLDGSAGYEAGTESNYPMNGFVGTWYLLGIVAASMSTADGAIVALGTVFSHNLLRKTGKVSEANLLSVARACTLAFAIIAGAIAMTKPNETGYFLIVAFDIVLASGVVPLFALVYWKGIKPEAGFAALLAGAVLRFVLEFALPKDGLLLMLGSYARNFGPGIEDPEMFDEAVMFGKLPDVCPQESLMDMTGVDSLASPVFSLLVLLIVQAAPTKSWGRFFVPVPAPAEEGAEPKGGDA